MSLIHRAHVLLEASEILSDSPPQIVNSYLFLTLLPFNRLTRFLVVAAFCLGRGRGGCTFGCVLSLEFLNPSEHEVFAVLDNMFGFWLVAVVKGGYQVGDTHVVLRKVRFV